MSTLSGELTCSRSFSFSVVIFGPFHSLLVSCFNKGGCLASLEKLVFLVKDTDNSLDCHLLLLDVLKVKEANLNLFFKKKWDRLEMCSVFTK